MSAVVQSTNLNPELCSHVWLIAAAVGLFFVFTSPSTAQSITKNSETQPENDEVVEVTVQNAPLTVFNLINDRTLKTSDIRELLDLITTFPRPDVGEMQMADQLNKFGMDAFNQNNFALATKLFTRATKANPSNTSFWCNLAAAALKSKDYPTAQSAALQALVLHPYHRDIWDLMRQACEGTENETCRKNADLIFQALQPA